MTALVFIWYWRSARRGWERGTFEAARRRGDVRVMVRYANWLIRELGRTRAFDVYAWQPHFHEWKKTPVTSPVSSLEHRPATQEENR